MSSSVVLPAAAESVSGLDGHPAGSAETAATGSARMAPARMRTLLGELKVLARLSAPVVLTQLGLMLMGVVDTLMLSRLGVTELAASALGNAWQWTWMSFGLGLVIGIDPLISQAHGRGDGPGAALALQRGVVLAVAISVPIGFCLWHSQQGLLLLGQDPAVAELAARYNRCKLATVPGFLVYT